MNQHHSRRCFLGRSILADTVWSGVVLVVLAVLALAPAPLVFGQGAGAIRLVGEEQALNFPDRLEFVATVESINQLVQARVNYRIVGSRAWTYANVELPEENGPENGPESGPESGPGNRSTLRFGNLLQDSVHLPPGTNIEYYYIFSDGAGNSLETQLSTFEYFDNRYQWQELDAGPLTLLYHDISQSTVAGLADQLAEDLSRVSSLLQLRQVDSFRGFVYNSFREAAPAFPNQSRTITEQQVFHGFAFPSSGVFLGIGLDSRIIVHESAHLMLQQSLESGGRPIPAWLDEGFASYVEPGSRPYSGQSLSSQGLPLRAMSVVSGTPQGINYFYLKSESVVAYLIEEHGVESFQRFLASLRRGNNVDLALSAAYGFDLTGLEANWAISDSGRSRSASGRFNPATPFLLFNSWFLSGLILIVVTIVSVRYVIRKIRPPSDDGSFYWDD